MHMARFKPGTTVLTISNLNFELTYHEYYKTRFQYAKGYLHAYFLGKCYSSTTSVHEHNS